MMTPVGLILVATLGFCAVMAGIWAAQRLGARLGWTDVAWTFGLGLIGAAVALTPTTQGSEFARRVLVALMILAWSARLGSHIVGRMLKGGDDPRYVKLSEEWGDKAAAKMLGFLQLQAVGGLPLLLAVMLAAHAPRGALGVQDWLGLALLLISVVGEGLADSQLKRFSADPANKGKVCDAGLWRWSRHPNYFFEWLGWVSYPVIAISLDGANPWAWLSMLAPAAMYHFLVNVSGIPPLEAHMEASRGEAFRAYKARTSAFFPLPPKSSQGSPR